MLIRLLIYVVLGVLIYRAVRAWFGGGQSKVQPGGQAPPPADDVMIQDPQCGVYFARRDGVSINQGGQELIFCSEACKEKYLALHRSKE
ncbi:MAG: hypothetical protein M0036_19895 [Desulfobacteraceae bacterium]|nr:hypothetical protein [Desulfobacteraceae bacterium]